MRNFVSTWLSDREDVAASFSSIRPALLFRTNRLLIVRNEIQQIERIYRKKLEGNSLCTTLVLLSNGKKEKLKQVCILFHFFSVAAIKEKTQYWNGNGRLKLRACFNGRDKKESDLRLTFCLRTLYN